MKNLLRLVSGIALGLGLSLLIVPSRLDYMWNFKVGLIPISDSLKVWLALAGGLLITLFAMSVLIRRLVERRLANE